MKKIDRFLIGSFIPPFIVTFMIAVFVLVMQTLWLYIDDIAGKGLGFFLIIELLAYKSVALIPLALPLAMLISSVMVLGNLAERYELSSLKSAGVSLLRVMRPLMFFGLLSIGLSYFCSNNLIPVANLKFGSRMYDIQRQKPTLRLDEGIFNDDFKGYAIHIGKKEADGRNIKNILIYDHNEANQGRLSEILAAEGEMYGTEDGKYFIMNLRNGHQYVETKPNATGKNKSYPFVRTSFREWTKVFDLSEFVLSRTNEELFKSNRSMMSSAQLRVAIDSIEMRILKRKKDLSNHLSSYLHFVEMDSAFIEKSALPPEKGIPKDAAKRLESLGDTTKNPIELNIKIKEAKGKNQKSRTTAPKGKDQFQKAVRRSTSGQSAKVYRSKTLPQFIDKDIGEFESFVQTFKKEDQKRLINKAKTFARSIHGSSESAVRTLDRIKESRVKHIYDLHTKYSMALVCFIFLFIGAPMGAIIRKGGFGYPILIAIIFFMLFIVLTIFCRKIAESYVVTAAVAGWIPCSVLFPLGLVLTYKAMNDSKLLNADKYLALAVRLFKKKKKA